MVMLSRSLLAKAPRKAWIDSFRIYVKGGPGGTGLPTKNGVGGRGGSVYVEASDSVKDLLTVKKKFPTKRFLAEPGENSRPQRIVGGAGSDVVISSPVGISLVTDHGEVLGDLVEDGQRVLVARGGPGGDKGTNYLGQPGQALNLKLDLKLIADVGFVGFPNAGKSTLLKAISRASPKIANYPFTTIRPNLGIVEYEDARKISLADLPGLIEGASYNLGMGHKFLKHVERTRLLMFVVDINGFQLKTSSPHRSALDTVLLLTRELELYKQELLDKPAVLVVNKMDSKGSEELFQVFQDEYSRVVKDRDTVALEEECLPERMLSFDEIIPISAKFSEKSVELLKVKLRHCMDVNDDLKTIAKVDSLRNMLEVEGHREKKANFY